MRPRDLATLGFCLVTAGSITALLSWRPAPPPPAPSTSKPPPLFTPSGVGVGKQATPFTLHEAETDKVVELGSLLGRQPVVLIFDSFT